MTSYVGAAFQMLYFHKYAVTNERQLQKKAWKPYVTDKTFFIVDNHFAAATAFFFCSSAQNFRGCAIS